TRESAPKHRADHAGRRVSGADELGGRGSGCKPDRLGAAVMKRLLRGPAAARVLAAMGIDARRFWLLNDLFRDLAEAREILSQLGGDGVTLKIAGWVYVVMGGFLCLTFLASPPQMSTFLLTFSGFTALLLGCTLVSEAGNSLVNPAEGLVLAHQPIDGAT